MSAIRTALLFLTLSSFLSLALLGCDAAGKSSKARQEIGLQAQALMQKDTVPTDQAHFNELTEVVGSAIDPWGNRYVYERKGTRDIKISSKGPDEKAGTADDVSADFTFPSGTGLEKLKVVRADGTEAIKSPDGAHSFWTTEKDVGDKQITDYWVGDGTGAAEKPIRSQTVDTDDFRRGVTLIKWSMDGKYLVVRDLDSSTRPDDNTKQVMVTLDATTGKEVDAAKLPADLTWQEY